MFHMFQKAAFLTVLTISSASFALSNEASNQLARSYSNLQSLSSNQVLDVSAQANESTDHYRARLMSMLTSSTQKIAALRAKSAGVSDQFFILGKDAKNSACLIRITRADVGQSTEQHAVMVIPSASADPKDDGHSQTLGLLLADDKAAAASVTEGKNEISIAGQTRSFAPQGAPNGQYDGLAQFKLSMNADSMLIRSVSSTFTYSRAKELHGLAIWMDALHQSDPNGYKSPKEKIQLNYACTAVVK